MWRLQVQLRANQWPEESIPIFGFARWKGEYPMLQLGKGYPRGDSMAQTLALKAGILDSSGYGMDTMSGMWIPCGENRCFLSNWEEAEVDIGSLRIPSEENAEEMDKPQKNIRESEREGVTGNAAAGEQAGHSSMERTEDTAAEKRKEAGRKITAEGIMTEEITAAEITVEAMECPEDCGKRSDTEQDGIEEAQEEQAGQKAADGRKRQVMERAWSILRARSQSAHPFAEEECEYIRICPRDVRWLGTQQWPIGQNSFLLRGFYQYRHLLLGRGADGVYLLCVPGRDTAQERSQAGAFGFERFKTTDSRLGYPENFGYWCRTI